MIFDRRRSSEVAGDVMPCHTKGVFHIGILAAGVFCAVALDGAETGAKPFALIISLPGRPNPPKWDKLAGRLWRGAGMEKSGAPRIIEPTTALVEAALRCGQRQLDFRGLDTDHGNELMLTDNAAGRRAIPCIARHVPFDFYVRKERR